MGVRKALPVALAVLVAACGEPLSAAGPEAAPTAPSASAAATVIVVTASATALPVVSAVPIVSVVPSPRPTPTARLTPTPAPTPTTALSATPSAPASGLPVVELKYRVFADVGRPWYCDPDYWPIARQNELDSAREHIAEMQADAETYAAILGHNGIAPGATLTDEQLLGVYRDWKQLRALDLQPLGDLYTFSIRVQTGSGDKQTEGVLVDGRIDRSGTMTIVQRAPTGPPICPICLAASTRIDTPLGPVAVTDLRVGDLVWTFDERGERIGAPILETGSAEAPAGHEVVRLALADGRSVTASPGHPLADGRPLGSVAVGDPVDGSTVVAVERLPYQGRTYDLLPAGATGVYWADGVPVGSTLRGR